ncbi:Protein of unknown function [Cotesia congregata]|uniref:Uncharacterized protein n=1 Tax=Cotesia congregata TaxID=51543 RepID=A0A8J2HJE0_COTCN|nr:Protein of unknown function [Cotesia congregata]
MTILEQSQPDQRCDVVANTQKLTESSSENPKVSEFNHSGSIPCRSSIFQFKVVTSSWKMLGRLLTLVSFIYFFLVRSRLEYAAIVWSPIYDVYSIQIDKVQHKFLKFLSWKIDRQIKGYNMNINLSCLRPRSLDHITLGFPKHIKQHFQINYNL